MRWQTLQVQWHSMPLRDEHETPQLASSAVQGTGTRLCGAVNTAAMRHVSKPIQQYVNQSIGVMPINTTVC